MTYVLFDIGGTKTRVSLTSDLKTFCEPLKYDTPVDSFEEGIEKIAKAAKELCGSEKITAVAGGMRGPLNKDKSGNISDMKLTDWVGKSVTGALSKVLEGAPVYLENDTAVVGLGEAHFGAGKGSKIMVYHTVSTGVGGVRIVEGKIDVATVGFEPGKQILDVDRSVVGKGTVHTLENLVSGSALEKERGIKPYDIPQSDEVWGELAFYLSRGLRNTIVYWSPDTIVLGGSMIVGDPRILLKDIIRHTTESLGGFLPCPKIVDAELGDFGGLYGAMALLSQKV